jgi:hypothetical protein
LLDTVTETTATVFLTRRLAVLDAIGSAVTNATDAESIMSTTTRLLAEASSGVQLRLRRHGCR